MGRDFLEVQKDYQGQILLNYSCHSRLWVCLFLEKCSSDISGGNLIMVVAPK